MPIKSFFSSKVLIPSTIEPAGVRTFPMAVNGRDLTGHEAVPEEEVFHGGGPVERCRGRVVDEEVEEECHVVVQVLADPRQVMHDGDVELPQVLFRPDTGQE